MTIRHRVVCLALLVIYLFPQRTSAQNPVHTFDSTEVVTTIDDFVSVFSNLEWDKFTTFFAEDATAFFLPSAKFPYRANNKTEIEKVFKAFFDTIKAQKANPPYLTIKPIDLKIQIFSSTAVVTFMLDDLNLLGRRTFILEKQNGKWLIVHLHASGVATTD